MKFYEAQIAHIEYPHSEIVSLIFDLPDDQIDDFDYNPGQHIIVEIELNSKVHRKPYALFSSEFAQERPSIIVERQDDGIVSKYLHDDLQVGDTIRVSEAQGFFYANLNASDANHYLLFAEDLGMAALRSVLFSTLLTEPLSRIHLFYSVKEKSPFLFMQELKRWKSTYSNRLKITFIKHGSGIMSGPIEEGVIKGKFEQKLLDKLFQSIQITPNKTAAFICCREESTKIIKKFLMSNEIDSTNIQSELFYRESNISDRMNSESATVKISNNDLEIKTEQNQSILQGLKNSTEFNPPYGCENGLCGACAAKLIYGDVHMRSHTALNQQDLDDKWILTCQAFAKSTNIEIKYYHYTVYNISSKINTVNYQLEK